MNRKQLILILAGLIIVGSAGLILFTRDKDTWDTAEAKMGDKVFANFQPNDIAAIHIKGRTDLNLVRKNDGWHVEERENFPADFHQISDALIKLKDLKVVEADTVSPSDLARVNLDEPGHGPAGGTLVEFKDAQGKVINSLLIGKKHIHEQTDSHSLIGSEPDGCYVLLPGNPREVMLIGEPLGVFQPNPASWLAKDFLKIENVKSLAAKLPNAADSWKIARAGTNSPWTLDEATPVETLDTNRASSMAEVFASPRFVDVLSANSTEQTGLDKPLILTIQTFDGLSYKIKVGAKSPDGNYYVAANVTADNLAKGDKKSQDKLQQQQALAQRTYIVGSWILDPVLRQRSQIMEGATDDTAANTTPPSQPAPAPTEKGATNSMNSGWTPHVIQ